MPVQKRLRKAPDVAGPQPHANRNRRIGCLHVQALWELELLPCSKGDSLKTAVFRDQNAMQFLECFGDSMIALSSFSIVIHFRSCHDAAENVGRAQKFVRLSPRNRMFHDAHLGS